MGSALLTASSDPLQQPGLEKLDYSDLSFLASDAPLFELPSFRPPHSNHAASTDLIRKALANTQWPSSVAKTPVIRQSFDRRCEVFASPRADLVPLASTDFDRSAATLTADRSPTEGYLTESVDSPASARDFLTSPSLFDECDFDFEADGALPPLFPGTTFDSQVNDAESREDEPTERSDNTMHTSASQIEDMFASQTTVGSTTVQSTDLPQLNQADSQTSLMAQLRDEGLSCFMMQPEASANAASQAPAGAEFYTDALPWPKTVEDPSFMSSLDREEMERHLRNLMEELGMFSQPVTQDQQVDANMVQLEIVTADGTKEVRTVTHHEADEIMRTSGASLQANDAAGAASAYSTPGSVNGRKRSYSSVSSSLNGTPEPGQSPTKYVNTGSRPSTARLPKGRRFQCEVCAKWFDRAFNLKTHMFTHEDPDSRAKNFFCPDPDCGKAFARKHDMNRHHTTVHLKTAKRSPRKSPTGSLRDDDQG